MKDDRPEALDFATPRQRRSLVEVLTKAWQRYRVDLTFLLATAWLVLLVFAGVWGSLHSNRDETFAELAFYVLCASGVLTWISIRGRSDGQRLRVPSRLLGGIVAAVVFAGMFGVQSCPHATYLRIGPLLVTVAGRACHNPQPAAFWPAAMAGSIR